MAINFPNSPANNQIFIDSASGNQYVYNSATTKWKSYTTQVASLTTVIIDYGSIADTITGSYVIDYGSIA